MWLIIHLREFHLAYGFIQKISVETSAKITQGENHGRLNGWLTTVSSGGGGGGGGVEWLAKNRFGTPPPPPFPLLKFSVTMKFTLCATTDLNNAGACHELIDETITTVFL